MRGRSASWRADDPAAAMTSVRVFTVDDHVMFREVAAEVIAATAGFELVGQAGSGREALAVAPSVDPELVLLDVRMPGMDGLETARRIAARRTRAVVVLLSLEDTASIRAQAALSGAVAVVRKQDFGPTLLRRLCATHGTAKRDTGAGRDLWFGE
jgi:DNA-binding NarL/FixJ family response regulator